MVARKTDLTATVKKPDAVHDGEGGFYPVGAKITCPDEETLESLRDKGLVD